MRNEDRAKKVEEARLWCDAEGCEGADYLRCLADALSMAHYSQDERFNTVMLSDMIERELEGWRTDERIVDNVNDILAHRHGANYG